LGRTGCNYAAKLSALYDAKPTWITKAAYDMLHKRAKNAKNGEGEDIWVKHTWTPKNDMEIYFSIYRWSQ
jgi:hypothetical protein